MNVEDDTVLPLCPPPSSQQQQLQFSICIICSNGSKKISNLPDVEYGKFLKEVLQLDKEESNLNSADLEVLQALPVCLDCVEVIRGAMEKKACADEWEANVKELQAQVTVAMNKLEVEMKEFYLGMRRMEEIVSKSNWKKLEATLSKGNKKVFGKETNILEVEEERSADKKGENEVDTSDLREEVKGSSQTSSLNITVCHGQEESGQVISDMAEATVGVDKEMMMKDLEKRTLTKAVDSKEIEEEGCQSLFVVVKILRDSILFVARNLQEKQEDKDDGKRRKSKRLKGKSRQRYKFDGVAVEDEAGGSDLIMPFLHCSVKMEDGEEEVGVKNVTTSMPKHPKKRKTVETSIPEFNITNQIIKTEPLEAGENEGVKEGDLSAEGMVVEGELEVICEEIITVGGIGHQDGRLRRKSKPNIIVVGGDEDKEGDGVVAEEDYDSLSNNGSLDDEFSDTSDDDFFLDEEIGSGSESSSSSSSSGDDGNSSEEGKDDWDDGEEYGRKSKKKKLKVDKLRTPNPDSKKSRKAAYTKMMDLVQFGRMSKLKRKLVQRVIHKKFRRPTRKPKTPRKEEVQDPRLQHFIEYDTLTDKLSLGGIFIHLHEAKDEEDGEDILILECSACEWRAKPAHNSRHPVDSFMYNHIAGQHLNLFQCVQCGSNLGGYKQYSDHVLGHRMGFACDVCGRPLGGAQALARHKWSHLNEQESAELVSKGLKDPREKKEPTKIYPCPSCGKIFPQRCQLKKHEKVHAEVRERITCEICGKLFLPSGFISHKRYYCFPEGVEQPRISCPMCPKVFKNKQFMQVHMDRAHNTERNHKCAQCGKGFKTKKDLMTHEETHTTERAFSCKKGCGRTYKTRKNCNAHEKRCDGRGGILIQRFLDAGDERPFSCRKGCGRAYKTRRTLRGHEKTCHGSPFVSELGQSVVVGGVGQTGGTIGGGGDVTTMTSLGAALQASMEAVMGGGVIQTSGEISGDGGTTSTTIIVDAQSVPMAIATEIVVTKDEFN